MIMEIIDYILLCLFLTPFIIIVGLYFLATIYLPIYMLCEYRTSKKKSKANINDLFEVEQ